MATGVTSWSQTAATNATADSAVNFAEGQAPSSVNDAARGLMASVAKYRDDNSGTLVTGGTTTAYTLTSNQGFATLAAMDGASLRVKFNATNGAAPTLAVDGLTAKPIQIDSSTAVPASGLSANTIWSLTYNNSVGAWIVNSYSIASGTFTGAVSATTLAASGAATLSSTLAVTGNTTVGGTLGVTGATTLNSTLAVSGNTTLSGTLAVTGATTLSGTITIADTTLVGNNAWTSYSPSVSAGSGSFSSTTATGHYKQFGKTCFTKVDVTLNSVGSGGTSANISLPFASNGSNGNAVFAGKNRSGGIALIGYVAPGSSTLICTKYDGTGTFGDGTQITFSGEFETA